MGFLSSLLGLKPPTPKAGDTGATRQQYIDWVRKKVAEGLAAHKRQDYDRRDAIWGEFRNEAPGVLTLQEVIAIDTAFLLEWKVRLIQEAMDDAYATGQIGLLERLIKQAELDAGSTLDQSRVRSVLSLRRYENRLCLLKINEAIQTDNLTPLETGIDGSRLFAREQFTHRREDGWLSLTDKGVLFEGMVRIEFLWTDVQNIAVGGGKDADEIGFQEGKRRTATRFAISDDEVRERVKAIADWLWANARS